MAILSSTEQRFMEASMAYAAGKPFLSDDEYDDLKRKLRQKNSKVVQQVRRRPILFCAPLPCLVVLQVPEVQPCLCRGHAAACAAGTCTATATRII